MEGLTKGVYVALYQTEFNQLYNERKLVFSIYCNQPIHSLRRIGTNEYPSSAISTFENALQAKVERYLITQVEDEEN